MYRMMKLARRMIELASGITKLAIGVMKLIFGVIVLEVGRLRAAQGLLSPGSVSIVALSLAAALFRLLKYEPALWAFWVRLVMLIVGVPLYW
jgi:hypothetical protein